MHRQKNDDEPNGLVDKKNEELASEGKKALKMKISKRMRDE